MIKTFHDKETQKLFETGTSRKLPNTILKTALRKLDMIDAATSLDDLRSPPGNRLESLVGDLKDFYSIRINQQWRIVFEWADGALNVQIVDYH